MGEVVVSGEQDMVEMREAEKSEQSNKKGKEEDEDGGSTTEMVRWEKYLPRMVLRVLLVEADDSTRQIISALLRKCSYRGQFFAAFIILLHCFCFGFFLFAVYVPYCYCCVKSLFLGLLLRAFLGSECFLPQNFTLFKGGVELLKLLFRYFMEI